MMPGFKTVITSAICLGSFIGWPTAADAQVTTIVNYPFNVPILKVVPNPCSGGFTLVNGTLSVTVAAVQQTTFQLSSKVTSTGSGKDALADGSLLIIGAGPDYAYKSTAGALATFPKGVPSYFEHTLTVTDFLVRQSPTLSGDSYVMRTAMRFRFNNGIPSAPTLDSISVMCQ